MLFENYDIWFLLTYSVRISCTCKNLLELYNLKGKFAIKFNEVQWEQMINRKKQTSSEGIGVFFCGEGYPRPPRVISFSIDLLKPILFFNYL